jgi:RNA polymerase sigma-70 factor (ECF subfamily)
LNLSGLSPVFHDEDSKKGLCHVEDNLSRAQTQLLILRLRRGETDAFSDLVGLWERRLFYFIRRIVVREEDAWDVLQETWMKVHSNIRQLRDTSAFSAWVYRIARHAAVSHLRREQRSELLHEDNPRLEVLNSTEHCGFSEDQVELIHWGLDQLPLPQREALTLFFLEGFSVNDIAAVTGVSRGTVKSRLHYGKLRLQEIIEKEAADHD